MMRSAVLVVAALVAFSATASAQKRTLSIAHFFGKFSGGGVAENEDSIYFAVTARDFDVVIGPGPSSARGGFTVTWTSVIRGGGDVDKPKVRKKSTSRIFAPGTRPGMLVLGGELGGGLDSARAILRRDLDYSDQFEMITLPTGDSLGLRVGTTEENGVAEPFVNYPLYAALGAAYAVNLRAGPDSGDRRTCPLVGGRTVSVPVTST